MARSIDFRLCARVECPWAGPRHGARPGSQRSTLQQAVRPGRRPPGAQRHRSRQGVGPIRRLRTATHPRQASRVCDHASQVLGLERNSPLGKRDASSGKAPPVKAAQRPPRWGSSPPRRDCPRPGSTRPWWRKTSAACGTAHSWMTPRPAAFRQCQASQRPLHAECSAGVVSPGSMSPGCLGVGMASPASHRDCATALRFAGRPAPQPGRRTARRRPLAAPPQ